MICNGHRQDFNCFLTSAEMCEEKGLEIMTTSTMDQLVSKINVLEICSREYIAPFNV